VVLLSLIPVPTVAGSYSTHAVLDVITDTYTAVNAHALTANPTANTCRVNVQYSVIAVEKA